MVLGRRPGQRD
jgi:hypothetical protein